MPCLTPHCAWARGRSFITNMNRVIELFEQGVAEPETFAEAQSLVYGLMVAGVLLTGTMSPVRAGHHLVEASVRSSNAAYKQLALLILKASEAAVAPDDHFSFVCGISGPCGVRCARAGPAAEHCGLPMCSATALGLHVPRC